MFVATRLLPFILLAATALAARAADPAPFDVHSFGAKGDGKTLDTDAINKAIDAANAAGGGTVYFHAGTYPSFSIHLKSNVGLYLGNGLMINARHTGAAVETDQVSSLRYYAGARRYLAP